MPDPKPVPFAHLHVHTTYSLLDGACQIKPLVRRIKQLGMTSCAITDHGNLFGIKNFYDACRDEGVKPILGCETYVAKDRRSHEQTDKSASHLILLAKNLTGYHNLLRLISLAWTEGFYYRPRIDKALLEKYHDGLICSSACIAGEIPRLVIDGRMEEAEKQALWYKGLFGDDYYLEIMRHKAGPDVIRREGEEPVHLLEAKSNKGVLDLGKKLGIKVIATNDVHFLREDDAEAHDILLCLGTGSKITDRNRMRYTRQEWFKSYEEMCANFPDNIEQIRNTVEVADKVESYELNSDPILPVFPIPESFGKEEDYRKKYDEENLRPEFGERLDKLMKQGLPKVVRIKFEADYLEHLTREGARARWPEGVPGDVSERIDFELDCIKKMGFPGYFLIVRDYIAAAREMGVSVGPGRGSAAGSVVAYCLKITNVNPMTYDLLFERFLNPDRISMPDIDVDFDDYGRGKVLEWVTRKYGADHVAHIVTFGQMAPKSAIKDVCRVMDVPLAESNRLAAMIPEVPKITFPAAIEMNPALAAEMDSPDPAIRKVLELAARLDGTVRQPGIHACGVIISRDPLTETIPVMPTEGESLLTTQYDGHFVEPIGLLKMDFLGLKTLTVIKECLSNIKEDYGIDIDIDNVPLDDKETYELFSRGETTGLFQFESEGMKKYLRELHPTCLEDLVAMNALYRPGPMQYIPQFINRKHGREEIKYDHPLMEKYLKTTYGVCVYQEQVMLLSRLLGGFTRGMSDTLRKAMGKKKLETMEKLKAEFVKGCLANPAFRAARGCEDEEACRKLIDKIWEDWKAFASYAFNKSHAVCYAYVAYQTGYLKAHYKSEFMCAQISSEFGKFDKLPGLVAEAAEMGLEVLPPNVNFSLSRFSPSGKDAIRYGLAGIKGVGTPAGDSIVAERKKNGVFKSYCDFLERVDPALVNKRALEALIKAGAFDDFGIARARLLKGADFVLLRVQEKIKERESGQQNLFDAFDVDCGNDVTDTAIPECPEWPVREKLGYERELLGVYLTGDPLDRYKAIIKDLSTKSFEEAVNYNRPEPIEARVCGLCTSVVRKVTKTRKEPMAVVGLESGSDKLEAVLFPKAYAFGDNAASLEEGQPMMACGELSLREGEQKVSFWVNEIRTLADATPRFTERVNFIVPYTDRQEKMIEDLADIVSVHPGKAHVTLRIATEKDETVVIESPLRVEADFQMIEEAEKLLGRNAVRLSARGDLYLDYKPNHYRRH